MRNLFIVGAKLLGIYWFIMALLSLISMIQFIQHSLWLVMIAFILSAIVQFIFSYLLLFKTHNIACLLKLEEKEIALRNLSSKSFLQIGITLIGLYIFTTNISNFLKSFFFYTHPDYLTKTFNINIPGVMNQYIRLLYLIINFMPIVISLILIFKSQAIAKLISKYEDTKIES